VIGSIKKSISDLIKKLNGCVHFLSQDVINQKELYHLMGVSTSNFLTPAIRFGTMIADILHLNKKDFLIPIIQQTATNCIEAIKNDEPIPLSGPIIRKDETTIKKHLNTLEQFPDLKKIYKNYETILINLHSK